MISLGVIGDPISHSLSPKIFRLLAKNLNRSDVQYEAIQVETDDLEKFLEVAKKKFLGLNVTLPHKIEVLKYANAISDEVASIGASNVLHFNDNKFQTFNTDVVGVTKSLMEKGFEPTSGNSLILGGGGAAQAVAFTLGRLGVREIFILNRTQSATQALASKMGKRFPKAKYTVVENARGLKQVKNLSLIVNSTSVGLGKVDKEEADFFEAIFEKIEITNALAFDLIYSPPKTSFLKVATAHGCSTLNGLPMLVHQAMAAWEIWLGKIPNDQSIFDLIYKYLATPQNIFLTGFMGVGKSTVAHILALKLGKKFIDLDLVIEAQEKMPVAEIFEKFGESKFRQIESRHLKEICAHSDQVVALGGGALNDLSHIALVKDSGSLIYLSCSVEGLVKRLETEQHKRPLLKSHTEKNLKSTVERLFKSREPLYRQALKEFPTDDRRPEDISEEIANFFLTDENDG